MHNEDYSHNLWVMVSLKNKIPALRSLIAFEAAARKLSFTKAADELAVTQVAISRQIKQLEDYLGIRLFDRLNRAVRLTSGGLALQSAVINGLSQIAECVTDLQEGALSNTLTVGTTTAFSAYWLMPRLSKFCTLHPEVDLRISALDECMDLKSSGIHISIRFGRGDWPGLKSTYFCDSDVTPLCSPSYWQGKDLIDDPRDLLEEFLIDFDYVIDSRWSSWFQKYEITLSNNPPKISIDAYTSMVNATLSGQGIA